MSLGSDLAALCVCILFCGRNDLFCFLLGTAQGFLICILQLFRISGMLLGFVHIRLHHLCPLFQHGIYSAEKEFFQKEKQHEDIDDGKQNGPKIKI